MGTADTPIPPLNLVGDYGGGGMLLAVGLLGAILEARQSGEGQVVDVAMYEGAALLMTVFYGLFAEGRWEDHRHANVLDGAAHYYRTYRTADGEHFAVGAMEPQFYEELCARLGVSVPQEDTPDAWEMHGATMATRFLEQTRAEWEAELVTPQSCASPILGLAEAPDHPHSRGARHLRHRRRRRAAGTGAALLTHVAACAVTTIPARRPHAGRAGRAGARTRRVVGGGGRPPEHTSLTPGE